MFHPDEKAQAAIEMLVALVVGLVILGVLIQFTSDQLNHVNHERAVQAGQSSMNTLISTINEVYAQGPGATKLISVTWPEGIVDASSSISNRSIRIRVIDTDITGTAVPLVTGFLPTNPGSQLIRIQAFDGFVSIGTLSLTLSPTSFFANTVRDSNQTFTLSLTNGTANTATLTYAMDWNTGDVNASLSSGSWGTLAGGATTSKLLTLSPGHNAVGTYAGKLTVSASLSTGVETYSIPVTLDVSVGSTSLLSVYPTALVISGQAGDTNTSDLQICNLGSSTLSGISFNPTSGVPGDYIQGLSDINFLSGQSCTTISVSAVIPSGTSLGSYVGGLTVHDFSNANRTVVPLTLTVQGMNAYLDWDWSGASLSPNNVSGFTLSNVGAQAITLSSVTISDWWTCDTNHSRLSTIRFNNTPYFSGPSVIDGNAADITDVNLPVLTSWTTNSLIFEGSGFADLNKQFTADVTFSDGTVYHSTTFGNGCTADIIAPSPGADPTLSGNGTGKIRVDFTFSGDDGTKGTSTGSYFRYSTAGPMTKESDFSAGTSFDYNGSIPYPTSGTSGTITASGLTTGVRYYFAYRFVDEAGNLSDIAYENAGFVAP